MMLELDNSTFSVGRIAGRDKRPTAAEAGLALRPSLKVLFITGYAEYAVNGDGHLKRGVHVVRKLFAMKKLVSLIKSIISFE